MRNVRGLAAKEERGEKSRILRIVLVPWKSRPCVGGARVADRPSGMKRATTLTRVARGNIFDSELKKERKFQSV
jgi:hypothetical protein